MSEQQPPKKSMFDQLREFLTQENLNEMVKEINQLYTNGLLLPSETVQRIEGINSLALVVGVKGFKAAAHPEAIRLWNQGRGAPFGQQTDRHGRTLDGGRDEYDDYHDDEY